MRDADYGRVARGASLAIHCFLFYLLVFTSHLVRPAAEPAEVHSQVTHLVTPPLPTPHKRSSNTTTSAVPQVTPVDFRVGVFDDAAKSEPPQRGPVSATTAVTGTLP